MCFVKVRVGAGQKPAKLIFVLRQRGLSGIGGRRVARFDRFDVGKEFLMVVPQALKFLSCGRAVDTADGCCQGLASIWLMYA